MKEKEKKGTAGRRPRHFHPGAWERKRENDGTQKKAAKPSAPE